MSKIVTYEQAKKLRKLGYNKECRDYYIFEKGKKDYDSLISGKELKKWNGLDHLNMIVGYCSAPTVSEALDFIREKKNIACGVHPFQRHNHEGEFICWDYTYAAFCNQEDLLEKVKNYISLIFPSYPEAESALLTAVLEYLKKGGGNE